MTSYDDFVATIRREADALVAAGDGRLDSPVPSCPGWQMSDLLLHVGDVHNWVAGIVRERAQEGRRRNASGPNTEPISYVESASDDVVEALSKTDPDEPVWNWAGEPPRAAFWARRMAHETALHRWDGENARGTAHAMSPDIAVDGIDEALRITLATRLRHKPQHRLAGTLHLHATDVEGEWLVDIAPDSLTVTNEHGKGDVAIRGAASDLLLVLYNRESADDVEVFGDRDLLERWREGVRF